MNGDKRDAYVVQNENGHFDIQVEKGDLKVDDGFETLIWMSLFTNCRASETQIAPPEKRSGWIGNLVSDTEDRELGSLLWLTDQYRLNQDTVNELVDYAQKSLDWMIEDQLVDRVDAAGEIIPKKGLLLSLSLQAGANVLKFTIPLWEATVGNI